MNQLEQVRISTAPDIINFVKLHSVVSEFSNITLRVNPTFRRIAITVIVLYDSGVLKERLGAGVR